MRRTSPLVMAAAAAALAALAAAGSCARSDSTGPTPGPLAAGTWGGDSAGVIVTHDAVHVHIKCTLGDIPLRAIAGADGRFDVTGTYHLRAYPIMMGPEVPARFEGTVRGNRLTLTVTVDDTVAHETVTLGPVALTLDQEPRLGPCPICRVRSPMAARAGIILRRLLPARRTSVPAA